MANKASALTYSTLLAIVPILAILFAVARGFGFDNLMEHQFRNGFGGNIETTEAILSFRQLLPLANQRRVFIGIGLVMLLWTVINLVSNIEITFNRIWEVKKARSMYRKITDYFSMFLLMPILIVVSGGLSLFVSTMLKQMDDFVLLAPYHEVHDTPYPICSDLADVHRTVYLHAEYESKIQARSDCRYPRRIRLSGFPVPVYQQSVWVSKYNAIYGSFAAFPCFCFGCKSHGPSVCSVRTCRMQVKISAAFSFDQDTRNISRRYRDFISILIMSLIAKRFEKERTALYSSRDIGRASNPDQAD